VATQDNRPGPEAGPGEDHLDRLLAERGDHLLHAAITLTGRRPDAKDLLQAAVERFLRRRRRVDDLEA
jgi:DNA-directed RNA polymerase specialized sigma24 family protein